MADTDKAILTRGQLKDLMGKVKEAQGSGGSVVLSKADYNYPTSGTADGIAVWLLDPGIYLINSASKSEAVKLYTTTRDETTYYAKECGTLLVSKTTGQYSSSANHIDYMYSYGANWYVGSCGADGARKSQYGAPKVIIDASRVVDSLEETRTTSPLSANAGYVVNKKIEDRIAQYPETPSVDTPGTVGKLLEDTTNGKLYQCTAVSQDEWGNNVYTWKEIGGESGGGVSEPHQITWDDVNYEDPSQEEGMPGSEGVALWKLPDGKYLGSNQDVVSFPAQHWPQQMGYEYTVETTQIVKNYAVKKAKLITYLDEALKYWMLYTDPETGLELKYISIG